MNEPRGKRFLVKIKVMQGGTCKRYRNKSGIKSTISYPATEHGKKERQARLHYICCKNVMQSSLSFFFAAFGSRVTQGTFHLHLVCVLLMVPSLHEFNFYRKIFTPCLLFVMYIQSVYFLRLGLVACHWFVYCDVVSPCCLP